MLVSADRLALGASLLVSLVLHLAAGVGLVLWALPGDQGARSSIEPAMERDTVEFASLRLPADEEPITLGLESSIAESPAWIGASIAEELFAKPSKVDQPELTLDPPSGPSEALDASIADAEAITFATPAAPLVEPPSSPEPAAAAPLGDDPGESAQTDPQERLGADAHDRAPIEHAPNSDPPASTPEAPPLNAVLPTDAASAGGGDTGKQSDRESSAASILTAEWRKLGMPLAGGGLEIRTRRPRFTQYTRLMGAKRDPIFKVSFRKDGRVDRVEAVETSGNPDVDRPVIDAIYQWRASGEPLAKLKEPSPPAVVTLEFRILL